MHFSLAKVAFAGQALLSCLAPFVSTQQFQGKVIPNSLPTVGGSEITYWNIVDKKGRNMTLTNYFSQNENGQRLKTSDVKRAVVIIHGLQRDPGTYMANILTAFSQLPAGGGPTRSNTQIIAPYFPNGNDKNIGYPWNASAPASNRSYTNALVWQGGNWIGGDNNQYPSGQIATSSYDVLDSIIVWFANQNVYPNLRQVVIAGHSAGAQTTQRYAAVGKDLVASGNITQGPDKFRVTYWVANPNSLLWFNTSRPLDSSSCVGYDDWRDGLSNFTQTYGSTLVESL